MPIIERTADVAATPEAVWSYLAHFPAWAEWDPDILAVSGVRGTLDNGGRFDVRMTRGLSTTIVCSAVTHARRVVWTGQFFMGLVTAQGIFELEPLDGGRHTRLRYRFGMSGPFGRVAGRLNRRAVVRGMEEGLANIVAAVMVLG
ncbi:MAG: SRPBCC family protein [Myxococcota bacterium]